MFYEQNIKVKLIFLIAAMLFLGSCNNPQEQRVISEYEGVPATAHVVAENEDYVIFFNDEAVADSIEGLPAIKQVSLWTYEKEKKAGKKVLTSHPHTNVSWFSMEHAVSIPLDSIQTITRVTILSWEGEPLKLLVEGCADYRNVMSFILEAGKDSAICLPTNRGFIGVSEEDGWLIMQSYDYYEEGGRYNVIEAFDITGKLISSMEAKTQ